MHTPFGYSPVIGRDHWHAHCSMINPLMSNWQFGFMLAVFVMIVRVLVIVREIRGRAQHNGAPERFEEVPHKRRLVAVLPWSVESLVWRTDALGPDPGLCWIPDARRVGRRASTKHGDRGNGNHNVCWTGHHILAAALVFPGPGLMMSRQHDRGVVWRASQF